MLANRKFTQKSVLNLRAILALRSTTVVGSKATVKDLSEPCMVG